ncbi:hypothetical protein GCM10025868_04050 [Angustibacter aerolatus]|uniref:Response regulatory domain-containing protein n=1 Tax=Angustibacter aerolatus TaxID=1162965 RepID=A0ABQ6JAE2_9ACTN|nr:hypothetical protein GCM10025868_04050 [Angustibacter aerolatus]
MNVPGRSVVHRLRSGVWNVGPGWLHTHVTTATTQRPERLERRPVLLTVDDDPSVSRSIARDLRRNYGEGYRVVRAESGADALDALRELAQRGDRVALLLADHRMPQMTGIEFLEQAMDLFPAAKRVLLTAYADTDAAIAAINTVDLDHYLLKPWSPPEEPALPRRRRGSSSSGTRSATPPPSLIRVVGHRWSARSHDVREFLARNGVPYQWVAADEPEGARLLAACDADATDVPVVLTPDGPPMRSPDVTEARRARRADHDPGRRLLRRRDRGRGPGRAGRGGVRGVRGVAHRGGRAAGDRRSGRAELAHRELPGLPGRCLGRGAHRPRAAAGRAVRRRDGDRARRRRHRGRRPAPRRPVRRRQQPAGALPGAGHRRAVPPAPGRARRALHRHRPLLRRRADRGGRLRRRGGLRRRRRELGRPGGGAPVAVRQPGGAAGARRVADAVDVEPT